MAVLHLTHLPTTTPVPSHLPKYCKVTDAGIIAVAKNCPNLVTLIAQDCGLTDASVIAISNNCPNLETLAVQNCFKLTDASMIAIATNCAKLTARSSQALGA